MFETRKKTTYNSWRTTLTCAAPTKYEEVAVHYPMQARGVKEVHRELREQGFVLRYRSSFKEVDVVRGKGQPAPPVPAKRVTGPYLGGGTTLYVIEGPFRTYSWEKPGAGQYAYTTTRKGRVVEYVVRTVTTKPIRRKG